MMWVQISEYGHFFLWLSAVLSLLQIGTCVVSACAGAIGQHARCNQYLSVAVRAVKGQAICLLCSVLGLLYGFWAHDFTLNYVFMHSHTQLPWIYRLCALWGGHEGSFLLWVLLLAGWSVAVVYGTPTTMPSRFKARIIGVMGGVSAGFLFFILFTSNPFSRIHAYTVPLQGRDLNPLLQDPGLVSHPPLLYMGYVGFSVAFAFVIAALLEKAWPPALTRWLRPWTLAAWGCLTLGIVLGSAWSYRELGWGGWWAWDPVENASLLPWLVGTALLHALRAAQVRHVLKPWVALLAIAAFILSLLGTFLVRSGVLISVHAFASDPRRGAYLLFLLGGISMGAWGLYAWRAHTLGTTTQLRLFSREMSVLVNGLLLFMLALTVLVGTVYPLFIQALTGRVLSVGAPYFNRVFLPFALPLLVMLGLAVMTRWQGRRYAVSGMAVSGSVGCALCVSLLLQWLVFSDISAQATLGSTLGIWILGTHSIVWKGKQGRTSRARIGGSSQASVVSPASLHVGWRQCVLACWHGATAMVSGVRSVGTLGLRWPGVPQLAMLVAHWGVGILAIGIAFNTVYMQQAEVGLAVGESSQLAGYQFIFLGVHGTTGPNFNAMVATVGIRPPVSSLWHWYPTAKAPEIQLLQPAMRHFNSGMSLSKVAISVGFWQDIYVALGQRLDDRHWALRLYYHPCVRWIWFGGMLMVCGALLGIASSMLQRKRGKQYAQ